MEKPAYLFLEVPLATVPQRLKPIFQQLYRRPEGLLHPVQGCNKCKKTLLCAGFTIGSHEDL